MALTRRQLVPFLLPACQLRAGGFDPAKLLEEAGRRYAAMTRFRCSVHTWQETDGGVVQPKGSNRFEFTFFDSTHFQCRGPAGVLAADGEWYWQYRQERKQYVRQAVAGGGSTVAQEYERLHNQYFGRFRGLGAFAGRAKLRGEKMAVGLLLPQIEIAEGTEWLEELWIHPAEGYVMQSAFSNRLMPGGRRWKQSKFAWGAPPEGDAPELRFRPPAKAREVSRFEPVVLPEL